MEAQQAYQELRKAYHFENLGTSGLRQLCFDFYRVIKHVDQDEKPEFIHLVFNRLNSRQSTEMGRLIKREERLFKEEWFPRPIKAINLN